MMGVGDFFRRWWSPPVVEVDYSGFSDERLLELEKQAGQLTEAAVTRLYAELDRRNLRPPPEAEAPPPVEEPEEETEAPALAEPFVVTPGGCVRLYLRGMRSILCVLPTSAGDPARTVKELRLQPDEIVEELVVFEPERSRPITDALVEHFNLNESRVHWLEGKPTGACRKFGARLEQGALTLLREQKHKNVLRAFWFGVEGTLMLGASLPFDAWLLTPFPTHIAGGLQPLRGPADVKRLERAGENDAWSAIRTVSLMLDVTGTTTDPYVTRLPEFGVSVRTI
jgi:hypothetical protein